MTTATQAIDRPITSLGPLGWVRKNLFSTWYNGVLTVISGAIVFFVLRGAWIWVFQTADWTAVTSNLKLLAVGQYPPDLVGRVGFNVLLISFLFGLSWGVWGRVVATFARAVGVSVTALALLPVGTEILGLDLRAWLLGNVALLGIGGLLGRSRFVTTQGLALAWVLAIGMTGLLLGGFGRTGSLRSVDFDLIGGLLLTFLLALVGIVASFPIGVLLALGRRSSLRMISIFSTLFIELIRGVPLVSILFMASLIFPLFFPQEFRVDRVVRALLGMIVFSAAYMAENVRGGLQSVPEGQIEAAKALGLSGPLTTLLIVLPQALRAVIPAIVGQFITLLKDTTLAVIVALNEILGIGKSIILGTVEFLGRQAEVYLFIAAVFWVFTFSMSYASRRLEKALGVGVR